MTENNKKILKQLPKAAGIFLLLYILSKINLKQLISIVQNVDIIYLVLAAATSIIGIFLIGLRWHILVSSYTSVSFLKIIKYTTKGITLGSITPGKIGELYRVKYITENKNITYIQAFITVLVDRLSDIFILLFGCLIFIIYYSNEKLLIFSLLLLFILTLFLWIFILHESKSFFIRIIQFFFKNKISVTKNISELIYQFKKITHKKYISIFILSSIVWLTSSFSLFFIAYSFDIKINLLSIIGITFLTTLINILPISFSGLGTTQASFIFLYNFHGISPETAIAISLLYIVITIWLYALPGGIFFIFEPKKDQNPLAAKTNSNG